MENSDQEHFGEASLGVAQSEDPRADPEMIDDDADGDATEQEEAADDQDAGPPTTAEPPDS